MATNTLSTISKAYKTIDDFTSDVKKVNTNYGALTSLNNDLKKSDFLKTGFSAMPYLNLALGFLNFFTGGGKTATGPTPVALTPTSLDLSGKISGTISNELTNVEGVFITPGSDPTGADDTKYPIYNQPMGVIAMTKTPKLKWYTSELSEDVSECCASSVMRNDVLFDRSIVPAFEYALNPASGLRIKEVQAAVVFEYHDPYHTYKPTQTQGYYDRTTKASLWPYYPTLIFDGANSNNIDYEFRTDYFPIECLPGKVFNFETQSDTDPQETDNITHVYLKLNFNLEKISGTGQNVLLVQTYDITPGITRYNWDNIRHVAYVPDKSTWNYNVKPEAVINTCNNTGTNSNFQPITSTRLSTLCHSTAYANSHVSSRVVPVTSSPQWSTPEQEVSVKNGILYPNPSSTTITLNVPSRVSKADISIIDVAGRKLKTYSSDINYTSNGSSITCSIVNLSKGIYFMLLQEKGKAAHTYKFIKE